MTYDILAIGVKFPPPILF